MGDPSSLNKKISDHGDGVLPFLRHNWWTTDYPCHLSRPLGLVSALGSRLRSNQDVIMGRVPMWGSSANPL